MKLITMTTITTRMAAIIPKKLSGASSFIVRNPTTGIRRTPALTQIHLLVHRSIYAAGNGKRTLPVCPAPKRA